MHECDILKKRKDNKHNNRRDKQNDDVFGLGI